MHAESASTFSSVIRLLWCSCFYWRKNWGPVSELPKLPEKEENTQLFVRGILISIWTGVMLEIGLRQSLIISEWALNSYLDPGNLHGGKGQKCSLVAMIASHFMQLMRENVLPRCRLLACTASSCVLCRWTSGCSSSPSQSCRVFPAWPLL